jgi:hypothetical protein
LDDGHDPLGTRESSKTPPLRAPQRPDTVPPRSLDPLAVHWFHHNTAFFSSLLSTPQSAVQYWQDRAVAPTVIPEEQCRKVKPRFLADCGNGPLIYVRVPVENRICRLYRDDEVKIQIQYDERNHPVRIAVDMDPFKSIPLPFIGVTLHWAR